MEDHFRFFGNIVDAIGKNFYEIFVNVDGIANMTNHLRSFGPKLYLKRHFMYHILWPLKSGEKKRKRWWMSKNGNAYRILKFYKHKNICTHVLREGKKRENSKKTSKHNFHCRWGKTTQHPCHGGVKLSSLQHKV